MKIATSTRRRWRTIRDDADGTTFAAMPARVLDVGTRGPVTISASWTVEDATRFHLDGDLSDLKPADVVRLLAELVAVLDDAAASDPRDAQD